VTISRATLPALVAAALSILSTGCPCGVNATSRCEARCVVVASPAARGPLDAVVAPGPDAQPLPGAPPPQLTPFSTNLTTKPVRMAPYRELGLVCGRAESDDPVDDRDALLHRGQHHGQPRQLCPAFPTELADEPAAIAAPPCGPSACPNVQLRAEQKGTELHFLFYDSPGAHTREHPCYYRLYAVSVSWDGKAP
jgi:hypothetical protein